MELLRLADAIERHVHDGQSIALEGFTHLIPHAAGHEFIRQRRRANFFAEQSVVAVTLRS
jgi:glutaconate CoA-transferase, subunit A